MGDVVSKKFDLSVSSWIWNIDRSDIVQFAPISKHNNMLVWTPKNLATDFGLFTRDLHSLLHDTHKMGGNALQLFVVVINMCSVNFHH